MVYKSIFSGHLEFGNQKSIDRIQALYAHRAENYYRNQILLKPEEIFNMEATTLEIPRHIGQGTEKDWKNTVNMLQYIVQYAIAGDISCWRVDEGRVVEHIHIEPQGDKTAIQEFIKGREMVEETGMEQEAKEALSRAIEKFERHAKAYERRGFVNYQLHNFKDALYDYSKSIDINPAAAEPYLGRGFVKMAMGDLAGAIADFEKTAQQSIPLQSIYWKARRVKGECHLKLQQYDKAAFELKFFTQRPFTPDNSNFKWRKMAFFNYGKAQLELGQFKDSVQSFAKAISTDGIALVDPAEFLLYRGIALKKAGQNGYMEDWQAAAQQGSERAAELLNQ
ncbi:MAG TPA: hypothetical protein PKA00_05810 [Saprospiraceae bacterium]|nr:hypothetical protein [Saprospiraceae bacterium]HMQ82398.1 hypothetical protein [Saprospiraceae bacterium]